MNRLSLYQLFSALVFSSAFAFNVYAQSSSPTPAPSPEAVSCGDIMASYTGKVVAWSVPGVMGALTCSVSKSWMCPKPCVTAGGELVEVIYFTDPKKIGDKCAESRIIHCVSPQQ